MSKFFSRLKSDLERNLKNIEFAFKVHLGVFILNLIVFVFFGAIPLITTLKTKYLLLQEMNDRYLILQSNLVNLEAAQKALDENQQGIEYLEKYMPYETSVQNYILDFVDISVPSGFVVMGFSQDPGKKSGAESNDLTIFMEGRTYPTDLIKTIEVLKRVTQVKSYTVINSKKDGIQLNLVLTIFNYVI